MTQQYLLTSSLKLTTLQSVNCRVNKIYRYIQCKIFKLASSEKCLFQAISKRKILQVKVRVLFKNNSIMRFMHYIRNALGALNCRIPATTLGPVSINYIYPQCFTIYDLFSAVGLSQELHTCTVKTAVKDHRRRHYM